jgi:hypothetical protein
MQHPNKHTRNTHEKTDEKFGTDTCNICVQPLQYVQHPNLSFQHPYETLTTYF